MLFIDYTRNFLKSFFSRLSPRIRINLEIESVIGECTCLPSRRESSRQGHMFWSEWTECIHREMLVRSYPEVSQNTYITSQLLTIVKNNAHKLLRKFYLMKSPLVKSTDLLFIG